MLVILQFVIYDQFDAITSHKMYIFIIQNRNHEVGMLLVEYSCTFGVIEGCFDFTEHYAVVDDSNAEGVRVMSVS